MFYYQHNFIVTSFSITSPSSTTKNLLLDFTPYQMMTKNTIYNSRNAKSQLFDTNLYKSCYKELYHTCKTLFK